MIYQTRLVMELPGFSKTKALLSSWGVEGAGDPPQFDEEVGKNSLVITVGRELELLSAMHGHQLRAIRSL